jgi:hypothetical protein
VYSSDEYEGPVDGEAHNVAGLVEIEGARRADRERPVERGEIGGGVAWGHGALDACDEADKVLVCDSGDGAGQKVPHGGIMGMQLPLARVVTSTRTCA